MVTFTDIQALIESNKINPCLVIWPDGTKDIVPKQALHHGNPLGWSENGREIENIIDRDDIFEVLEKPSNLLNDEDIRKIVERLNQESK